MPHIQGSIASFSAGRTRNSDGTWKMLVHRVKQKLMLMLKPPPTVSLTCSIRKRASLSIQQLLKVHMSAAAAWAACSAADRP